ncbi:MAG TPA: protein-glutamate O-methyltransferase [Caulobacteraceae bacterium]|jgi:chemotaxis protein methyltransferase CheR
MTAELRSRDSQRQIVEGEFLFTEEDFARIAKMLHDDAGIYLPEAKATLVYSRLAKRLRALGLQSFRDYCAMLAEGSGDSVGERQQMLAALTTNVTRFFREPHHFEHLKAKVLPPLLDAARRGGRVRLWSAACSTGPEPWSMALTVLSLAPDAAQLDLRILATDIDPNVVAEGKRGVYRNDAVEPIPNDLRTRWMQRVGQDGELAWSAGEEMRKLVSFRELNLIGSWPMKGRFDVIFCRNVVIYFEEETQARVWSRFKPLLTREGRLYIGHSERLNGPAAAAFVSDGLTTYRFAEGAWS